MVEKTKTGSSFIDTSKEKIYEILSRSIAAVLPSREVFMEALQSGKKLRIYIGADATGPQLHLGHATNFILLEKLRKLGHEAVVLFGDFTAMIGDPTDKDAARQVLSKEQVEANIATWKKQVSKILDFESAENPASILRNSSWLSKLTFAELIDIASSFTVQHMIERDMFERRMEAGKPVYLHEFFYPLMQGYDSVAMNVDVEIGGTDQTFNMLAGRTLQKRYNNKEKFVIATTLLVDPANNKKLMSKSEGSYIALDDEPAVMFGKTMALPDGVLVQMFVDCTYLPMQEIGDIEKNLARESVNPRDIKMRLAREIVTMYHNADEAKKAETDFIETFTKGNMPQDAPEISVPEGTDLFEVLQQAGAVSSRTEFRRLLEEGAIRTSEGDKIFDPVYALTEAVDIKVGKRRFLKIRIK